MKQVLQSLLAGAMLIVAAVLVWRHFAGAGTTSDKAFFYDLSKRKLFTGPRTAVPPIGGIDGPEEDAVRAVVISMTGNPDDKSSWKVAYLERYSPELKQQMEEAQATGKSPSMGRSAAYAHRFVRRENDTDWFSLDSPEAEMILSEWAAPGPDGTTPIVCSP